MMKETAFHLGLVDAPAWVELDGHLQAADVLHIFSVQNFGPGSLPAMKFKKIFKFRKLFSIAVQSFLQNGYYER